MLSRFAYESADSAFVRQPRVSGSSNGARETHFFRGHRLATDWQAYAPTTDIGNWWVRLTKRHPIPDVPPSIYKRLAVHHYCCQRQQGGYDDVPRCSDFWCRRSSFCLTRPHEGRPRQPRTIRFAMKSHFRQNNVELSFETPTGLRCFAQP